MSDGSLRRAGKQLFHRFLSNLAKSVWGYRLVLHAVAVVVTYLLVMWGIDGTLHRASLNMPHLQYFLFPAVPLGGLVPLIAPVALYIAGRKRNNERMKNTAFALGQAVIVANVIVSFYKAVTGRPPPPEMFDGTLIADMSRQFRFGFMNGGIFHGWPSGHTTTAFAMALVLIKLYPRDPRMRYLPLAYALYIGFGVSTNIHWFSDFVAGIFIGTAVGLAVGGSFAMRSNLPSGTPGRRKRGNGTRRK